MSPDIPQYHQERHKALYMKYSKTFSNKLQNFVLSKQRCNWNVIPYILVIFLKVVYGVRCKIRVLWIRLRKLKQVGIDFYLF